MTNEKKSFLDTWNREHQTTLKVMKAYPQDKQDLKPATMCKSAKELAWMFTAEENIMIHGITQGAIDFSKFTPAPATMQEVIDTFEKNHKAVADKVSAMDEAAWNKQIGWMTAPKTPGTMRAADLLWLALHDQIHHRGQLSIYLRMAGGKLPSIYGPTADEPWR